MLCFAKYETAAWPAKCLVRGRSDEVGVGHGRWVHTASDETGDVSNVGKKIGADGTGDLTHAFEVYDARIGGCAYSDHLWLFFLGDRSEFVVVDQASVFTDSVLDEFIELTRKIDWVAVREVTTVGKIHAEHFVAGL